MGLETPDGQTGKVKRLARTSDDILENVEKLRALEKTRRTETISTAPFHELADEIEATSKQIFRAAHAETELAEAVDTTDVTIDEVADASGDLDASGGTRRH